jgi:Uma2 family endonuclease
MEILTAPVTYQEFKNMEFSAEELKIYIFELINGEIMHRNYPSLAHQNAAANLHFLLSFYIRQKNLGKLYFAPFGVILDALNALQPDLIFVSAQNQSIVQEEGIFGVPDLLIEIISPSSLKMDRFDKFEVYANSGVPEYWLIDTNNQSVEIYENIAQKFKIFSVTALSGKVISKLFPDLLLEVSEIFG